MDKLFGIVFLLTGAIAAYFKLTIFLLPGLVDIDQSLAKRGIFGLSHFIVFADCVVVPMLLFAILKLSHDAAFKAVMGSAWAFFLVLPAVAAHLLGMPPLPLIMWAVLHAVAAILPAVGCGVLTENVSWIPEGHIVRKVACAPEDIELVPARRATLTRGGKNVLSALEDIARDGGASGITVDEDAGGLVGSQKALAAAVGCSAGQINKQLSNLSDEGLVVVKATPKGTHIRLPRRALRLVSS